MDPARPGADAGLSSTHHPLSRALADRYRIERKLGEGGMVSVFRLNLTSGATTPFVELPADVIIIDGIRP